MIIALGNLLTVRVVDVLQFVGQLVNILHSGLVRVHLLLEGVESVLHHLDVLHVSAHHHRREHLLLLLDPLVDTVRLAHQSVHGNGIVQHLFPSVGSLNQLVVHLLDLVDSVHHLRSVFVAVAQIVRLLLQRHYGAVVVL